MTDINTTTTATAAAITTEIDTGECQIILAICRVQNTVDTGAAQYVLMIRGRGYGLTEDQGIRIAQLMSVASDFVAHCDPIPVAQLLTSTIPEP